MLQEIYIQNYRLCIQWVILERLPFCDCSNLSAVLNQSTKQSSLFNLYCDFNQDIIQMIYDFIDIKIMEHELNNYAEQMFTTSIINDKGNPLLQLRTFQYLLITLILIPTYFPLFSCIQHIRDS